VEALPAATKLALDVTDKESIAAAGPVKALVKNAGISLREPAELTSDEDARRLFDADFMGGVRMTRAVLSQMRQRGASGSCRLAPYLSIIRMGAMLDLGARVATLPIARMSDDRGYYKLYNPIA